MNPQSSDWNKFWKNQKQDQFSHPSWSKRRILKTLKPFLKSGQRVLDAGCGSGFFSKFFCDQGLVTFSLDYADEALAMTRQITEGRAMILKKDLLKTPITEEMLERFDMIFSDGLLEHYTAEEQKRIVENFQSLLNNDGLLVTFVPNRFSPWEIIRPLFMPGIEETPFVLKELIRLNIRGNLTILRQGGINTLPFRFSPDRLLGPYVGMLLYTIARKS